MDLSSKGVPTAPARQSHVFLRHKMGREEMFPMETSWVAGLSEEPPDPVTAEGDPCINFWKINLGWQRPAPMAEL